MEEFYAWLKGNPTVVTGFVASISGLIGGFCTSFFGSSVISSVINNWVQQRHELKVRNLEAAAKIYEHQMAHYTTLAQRLAEWSVAVDVLYRGRGRPTSDGRVRITVSRITMNHQQKALSDEQFETEFQRCTALEAHVLHLIRQTSHSEIRKAAENTVRAIGLGVGEQSAMIVLAQQIESFRHHQDSSMGGHCVPSEDSCTHNTIVADGRCVQGAYFWCT